MPSELVPAEILGVSAAAVCIRAFVDAAARSSAPVFLAGEPGTGKQLAAQAIHERSSRRKGPILLIDCALYYERELHRELFGYGGGGAKSRKGVLEFADRGTCYLSHVEEISPSTQEQLRDFLSSKRFRRLGDGREISSDARVIASSDKNLEGFVHAGLFQEGLYDKLSEQALFLLPLRERTEDIPLLAAHVLASCAGERRRRGEPARFSYDSLEALKCYPWPMNLDEFTKEVSRLLDIGVREIRVDHLAMEIAGYWLGQRGDPETRKVLEELDGYIREFRILSRIGCEFGDPTVDPAWGDLHLDPERDLLAEF